LKENSTLCPAVSTLFNFEEDNDRTRFDSRGGASAVEPDGYSVARRTGKFASTYAADFAGNDNSWLRVPGIRSIGPGDWTVTAWVYPDTAGSAGQKQTLLANDFKNQAGTHVYLENASGSLYLKVSVTTAELDTTIIATSPNALTVSAWNFVTFGASPYPSINGQAIIFAQVNNSTKGTAALTYFPRAMNTETYLGARVSQAAGSRTPLDGGLDQLAFFADALNPTQVMNLHNGGTGLQYPWTDPAIPTTFNLTISGAGAYNQMISNYPPYTANCNDLVSDDGMTTAQTFVEPQFLSIACNVSDPPSGMTYNWIKVHSKMSRNDGMSFTNLYQASCPDDVSTTAYAGVYVNSASYWGSGVDLLPYWWGGFTNPGCGYPTDWTDVSVTYNTNPATGLAWTYNDLLNLQVAAKANVPDAPGGAQYFSVTFMYVEVNGQYGY